MKKFFRLISIRYRAYRIEQARLARMHDQFEFAGLVHLPHASSHVNRLRQPF
jgi:hypothetical protein